MVQVNELTSRTIQDAEASFQSEIYDKKAQLEADLAEHKDWLEEKFQADLAQQEASIRNDFAVQQIKIENRDRDARLAAKQEVVQAFLQDVLRALEALDGQAFNQLVVKSIKKTGLQGQLDLLLGQASKDLLDLDGVNAQLESSQVDQVQVLEDSQAGFKVRKGHIQYNFMFKNLIRDYESALKQVIVSEVLDVE